MTDNRWASFGPARKTGWALIEIRNECQAVFAYQVLERQPDGSYVNNPIIAETVVRPCRYEFSLAQLQSMKAGREFHALREKLIDKGIEAFTNPANTLELART